MAPAMVAFALAEKESLPKVIQAGAYFLSSDEQDMLDKEKHSNLEGAL